MASSAPLDISTNPNPRLRPVSRSVMTWVLVTVPYCPNSCCRSCSVVLNGRFPTYRFLLDMTFPPGRSLSTTSPGTLTVQPRHRSREDVSNRTPLISPHRRNWLGCVACNWERDQRG